jgi:hypothetical protein
MEWLPKLYEQHKDWPNLTKWIFVESADRVYAATSPHMVTTEGLSVDGTSQFLQDLAFCDPRIIYIPYGFCSNSNPALGKIEARQQYLDALLDVAPEFLMILDADEFYMRSDQSAINQRLRVSGGKYRHFCFQFTHIWHPQSIDYAPLFQYEVTGGFWDMRHTKGIRWNKDLRYSTNHQRPEVGNERGAMATFNKPHCIHMAFASNPAMREAKHTYYINRGEGVVDGRQWYVDSRDMFRTWSPGMNLPRGARVQEYRGPIPEAFNAI